METLNGVVPDQPQWLLDASLSFRLEPDQSGTHLLTKIHHTHPQSPNNFSLQLDGASENTTFSIHSPGADLSDVQRFPATFAQIRAPEQSKAADAFQILRF
jgi:hypothetical protein